MWKKCWKKNKDKETERKKGKENSKSNFDTEMDGGYNKVHTPDERTPTETAHAMYQSWHRVTQVVSGCVCVCVLHFFIPEWVVFWHVLLSCSVFRLSKQMLLSRTSPRKYRTQNIETTQKNDLLITPLYFLCGAQHDQPLTEERKQETALSEKAPVEMEKLGRLHFTLDYNFTDNMVRWLFSVLGQLLNISLHTLIFCYFSLASWW